MNSRQIWEAIAAKVLHDARKVERKVDFDDLDGWVIRHEATTRTGATSVSWWYGLRGTFALLFNTWGPLDEAAVYPTRRQAEAAYRYLAPLTRGRRAQRLADAYAEYRQRKESR